MKFKLLIGLLLAFASSTCPAQQDTLALKITPDQIPANFQAARVTFASTRPTPWDSSSSQAAEMPNAKLLQASEFFWTDGVATKPWGDQLFLVGYKLTLEPRFVRGQAGPEDLKSLTLAKTYVKVDQIQTFTWRADFTKEDLQSLLGIQVTKPIPPELAKAQFSAALSSAKQLALGTLMFCSDNDDVLPYAQSTKGAMKAVAPYLKNPSSMKSTNPNGGVFQFNMSLAGAKATDIAEPSMTPMYYEMKEWPDGRRIVVFCDGHTVGLNRDEWSAVQRYTKLTLKKHGQPLPADYGSELDLGG